MRWGVGVTGQNFCWRTPPPPQKQNLKYNERHPSPFRNHSTTPRYWLTPQKLLTYLLPCLWARLLPAYCCLCPPLLETRFPLSLLQWSALLVNTNDHFSSNKPPTLSVMSTWFTIILPKGHITYCVMEGPKCGMWPITSNEESSQNSYDISIQTNMILAVSSVTSIIYNYVK